LVHQQEAERYSVLELRRIVLAQWLVGWRTWFAAISKVAKLDQLIRGEAEEGCNGVGEMEGRRRPAYIAKFYAERDRFSYLYS